MHAPVYYLTACIDFGLGTNGNDNVRLIAIDNAELKLINYRFIAHFETPLCWRESEDRITVFPSAFGTVLDDLNLGIAQLRPARITLVPDRDR